MATGTAFGSIDSLDLKQLTNYPVSIIDTMITNGTIAQILENNPNNPIMALWESGILRALTRVGMFNKNGGERLNMLHRNFVIKYLFDQISDKFPQLIHIEEATQPNPDTNIPSDIRYTILSNDRTEFINFSLSQNPTDPEALVICVADEIVFLVQPTTES
jgi:hypothetical protein